MFRSVVLFALLLSSCRDEAAEALARAQLQHRALIEQAARPDDQRFETVILNLQRVPVSSRHFAQAQRLLKSIDAGRRQRVRTPLALGGNGRRPPRLEAQLAACARLAEIAGSDSGVDHRALVALETCRHEAEKMELELSHPGDHEEGGEHP